MTLDPPDRDSNVDTVHVLLRVNNFQGAEKRANERVLAKGYVEEGPEDDDGERLCEG